LTVTASELRRLIESDGKAYRALVTKSASGWFRSYETVRAMMREAPTALLSLRFGRFALDRAVASWLFGIRRRNPA
jgi:hypothetical protein